MEMQELEITISNDGQVQIGVKGVRGRNCVDMTRDLEETIGSITGRSFTHEYYEQEVSETHCVKEKRP